MSWELVFLVYGILSGLKDYVTFGHDLIPKKKYFSRVHLSWTYRYKPNSYETKFPLSSSVLASLTHVYPLLKVLILFWLIFTMPLLKLSVINVLTGIYVFVMSQAVTLLLLKAFKAGWRKGITRLYKKVQVQCSTNKVNNGVVTGIHGIFTSIMYNYDPQIMWAILYILTILYIISWKFFYHMLHS